MIIKLIQPKMKMRPMDTKLKTRMSPPLGLLTIANMFYREHNVIIENENIRDINYDEYVDIVGISITVDVLPRAVEIAKKFREKGVTVIGGGIQITACPDCMTEAFDAVSVGMAEKTWFDIVRDFKEGKLKKIYTCSANVKGSDIIAPAYNLLKKGEYLYTNIVSTSRGCPFKCDFCYNSCEYCRDIYINRPIEDVIADIKAINKKHIMFIDDNFIGNPKWTREFVKELKPLNIKWNAAVSSNIGDMPDLLDEMAESGCQSLFIGFESLNEKSLKDVHKNQNSIAKYERLVNEIHKRGIMINASFVFGLDGDDVTTFKTTLDWIIKNKIETVTSHILTPYPGTKLYADFLKEGRITDFDYSNYNTAYVVFKPVNMTAEELYEGYLNIYKEIYSLRNIVKRMPKSKKQILPYLMFNLFYRKFGKFSEWICDKITYERIGRIGEFISYFK